MKHKLQIFGLTLVMIMTLFAAACGSADKTRAVKIDSGVTNESYQGVMKPNIPKQLKLTEDEMKNGIQKVPIKSHTGQELIPETKVEDKPMQPEQQVGGGDSAKPQV